MALRYYYSRTSTINKITKIQTLPNATFSKYNLNWATFYDNYNENYNDGGGFDVVHYTTSNFTVGKSIIRSNQGGLQIPSELANDYFDMITVSSITRENYINFPSSSYPKNYTIPAGSYIFLAPDHTFVDNEDIGLGSGYILYNNGSNHIALLPSTTRSNNTNSVLVNDLSKIKVSEFEGGDGYGGTETYEVFANENSLIYYAATDIVVNGWGETYDGYNYSGDAHYVSGTLYPVAADVTTSQQTFYNVNTTGAYDYNYGGSYKGSYYLEPSSVVLTTTTPQAGKSATISVRRTSSTGLNASTYGFPITYKY